MKNERGSKTSWAKCSRAQPSGWWWPKGQMKNEVVVSQVDSDQMSARNQVSTMSQWTNKPQMSGKTSNRGENEKGQMPTRSLETKLATLRSKLRWNKQHQDINDWFQQQCHNIKGIHIETESDTQITNSFCLFLFFTTQAVAQVSVWFFFWLRWHRCHTCELIR